MSIIAIFGATGTQGSAVVEAVLADGKYTPRAVSRSLDSAGSKALIAKGVEVVVGNLWNKESLRNAIRDSEAVFGNTNFWDPEVFPSDPHGKGEIEQGKNLVDAAKEVALPNATKESNGLYKHIYHLDSMCLQGCYRDYLKASGIPYAVLLTGWFLDNLWKYVLQLDSISSAESDTPARIGALQKTDTGYTIPVAKFGLDDRQDGTWLAHDLGAAAVALLTHYPDPSKGVLGKSYPVISARFTYPQFTAVIAAAIKKEVTFTPLDTAGSVEFDEMFLFQAKVGMYPNTPDPNPDLVALGVKFGTLEEFIQKEVVPRYA
ncbi:NAD(P)-binding protein [Mycena capillaripes]|nr:NAD(P)-binding protein [Mycena capillaripes]